MYQRIFKYIEENIYNLEPESFTTDFEKAMRKGLQSVYGNISLIACWFHYTQALRRRCSKIGHFFETLSRDENANRIFHKVMALPLLPTDHIRSAFNMLKLALQCIGANGVFDEFFKYFERQWLKNVSMPLHNVALN